MNIKLFSIFLCLNLLSIQPLCFGQGIDLTREGLQHNFGMSLDGMLNQLDDINEVYADGTPFGTTLLCAAAGAGRLYLVSLLLNEGAEVMVNDGFIHDALSEAVRNGQANVASWFLSTSYYGNLPTIELERLLYYTIPNNDLRTFQVLSRKLPSPLNVSFYTDLMEAAVTHNQGRFFKYFAQKGGDLNARNNLGETFLHTAANNTLILDFLTSGGLDVNERSDNGQTPLHLCSNMDAVTLLLSLGAEINARDYYGWTPLHYAVLDGDAALVELLLEKGADPTISTELSYTALEGFLIERDSTPLDIVHIASDYLERTPGLQQKYTKVMNILQQ